MLPTNSRPYLNESVASVGFNFGSFLALLGFVVVVGGWVYSALPMLSTALGMNHNRVPAKVQYQAYFYPDHPDYRKGLTIVKPTANGFPIKP